MICRWKFWSLALLDKHSARMKLEEPFPCNLSGIFSRDLFRFRGRIQRSGLPHIAPKASSKPPKRQSWTLLTCLPRPDVTYSNVEVFLFTIFDPRAEFV